MPRMRRSVEPCWMYPPVPQRHSLRRSPTAVKNVRIVGVERMFYCSVTNVWQLSLGDREFFLKTPNIPAKALTKAHVGLRFGQSVI